MIYRGTGTTTQQMQSAPEGAVYIWPNSNTSYPINLARRLGRTDLRIKSLDGLWPESLLGLRNAIIIDHACYELTPVSGVRAERFDQIQQIVARQNKKSQAS